MLFHLLVLLKIVLHFMQIDVYGKALVQIHGLYRNYKPILDSFIYSRALD